MRVLALAFLCGVIGVQALAQLPDVRWLLLAAALPLGLVRAARPAAAALAGALWALLHAHLALGDRLALEWDRQTVVVEGVIAALPTQAQSSTRFLLDLRHVSHPLLETGADPPPRLPHRLHVAWYGDVPRLRVGELWRLELRLERPAGPTRVGGFDRAGWMLRSGIGGGASVTGARGATRLAAASGYPVERVREHLAQGLDDAIGARAEHGLVAALAIGERQHIAPAQWEVLRRTGTSHLVAISGLHIGLLAGLAYWLGRHLWPLLPGAAARVPAPYVGAALGLLAALIYAALAGFSVPTQRALIMVAVGLSAVLLSRRVSLSQMLALALLAVLLWDPMAVLAAGFWLSFGAVALIVYGLSNRLQTRGLWWRWGRVQWVVGLGLLPLTLAWFGTSSLISPLANLLAVPWVSVVVVPLTLAGTLTLQVLPRLGEVLLTASAESLALMWWGLERMSAWPVAAWSPVPKPLWVLGLAAVGTAWLLAPRGVPARWLGLLWLLPAVALPAPRPAAGEAWVTLLDGGREAVLIVATAHHGLVYASGGSPQRRDERVRAAGLNRGDIYVGGAAPDGARALTREDCAAGGQWTWDGVQFELLPHPDCVLRVQAGATGLLLAAGMKPSSMRPLLHAGRSLRADVLVAPRGTGRGAINPLFIDSVQAAQVLFTAPAPPALLEAYQRGGAQGWQLSEHGALRVRLGGARLAPDPMPGGPRRYWHEAQ